MKVVEYQANEVLSGSGRLSPGCNSCVCMRELIKRDDRFAARNAPLWMTEPYIAGLPGPCHKLAAATSWSRPRQRYSRVCICMGCVIYIF